MSAGRSAARDVGDPNVAEILLPGEVDELAIGRESRAAHAADASGEIRDRPLLGAVRRDAPNVVPSVSTRSEVDEAPVFRPYRVEHDVVKDLSQRLGVTVVGLNYKDTEPEALQWLAQLGDPYALSVVDANGQVGIDWGVYGVPETFVIDSRGVIRYKHIGPIKQQDVDDVIFPLIQELDQAT